MFIVASLVGCAPVPADVKFASEEKMTVYTVDPVAVQAASVVDAEGNAIEPMPALTWTVSPEDVAKLDGTNVVPLKSGEAMVKACATESICKEYSIVVALPDALAVTGPENNTVAIGTPAQVTAKVMSGTIEVPNQTVTYASDAPAVATVDDKGMVTGVTAGTANITATSGTWSGSVALTVVAAPPASTN
jgi:uncharacterized protein YjdB